MNQQQRSQLMLAATVFLLAVAVFLMNRNEQFIFQDKGELIVKADPDEADTLVFYWRSDVDVPMARRFAEAFEDHRHEARRILIDLNSPGGSLHEGGEVIEVIKEMKRTHIVDTRVRNRRACYSMCVPIFLQGSERIAAPNAQFMFHEPTARDQFTGEEVDEPEFEKRFTANRFFDRYFVDSPMDPEWRENLREEWVGKDVFRSAQDLVNERSGIVTRLE